MNSARLGPITLAVAALAGSAAGRPLARLRAPAQRGPVTNHQPLDSPRVWQADVSVQTLDVRALKRAGPITARVVVATGNDDARDVRLEMLLPVGVGVLHLSEPCRASASPVASLSARISCTLGDMPARALRELSVTTSAASAPEARARFAVFVYSDTPDPQPTNNFAERTLP